MKLFPLLKSYSSFYLPPFFFAFLLFFNSCNQNEVVVDESLLSKYNEMAHPSSASKASDGVDCYLDYSNGMCDKMTSVTDYYLELTNFLKLKGNSVVFYKVGASDTLAPMDINSGESDFRNPKNYSDPVSKLQVAVSKMTANKNRSSIFITDFEKIQGGKTVSNPQAPTPWLKAVDNTAWAQNDFSAWLKAGNQIDIFAKKILVNKMDNMLYTIVFTPDSIIKSESAYKSSVLKFLIDKKDGSTIQTTYTANNFKIEQAGKDEAIGNANDNLIVQENFTKTNDKGFEYYHFKSSDLVSFNTDATQEDKRIINKVKITSQLSGFTDVQFDIKPYDVTSSLTELYNSLTQEPPETKTNAETGVTDTTANKPIKFTYKQGKEVKDIFDFVYNTEKKETGIKIKPDFTGATENSIYKIDIIVKSVKLNGFSVESNSFKLNYPNNFSISPLSSSVEYAMKGVASSIEDKVLYSIYIKIDK